MKLSYKVCKTDNYKTVKDVLLLHFNVSHRLLIKLKNLNCIFVNNIKVNINQAIYNDDLVEINLDYEEEISNIVPSKMNLSIIYEDDSYIVINKPSGIPVHPSILHYEDSLANAVRYYFDSIGLKKKIRPVNRIDKDTSGIVIFAKNEYIQEELIKQMTSGKLYKEYIAIVQDYFDNKKRNY